MLFNYKLQLSVKKVCQVDQQKTWLGNPVDRCVPICGKCKVKYVQGSSRVRSSTPCKSPCFQAPQTEKSWKGNVSSARWSVSADILTSAVVCRSTVQQTRGPKTLIWAFLFTDVIAGGVSCCHLSCPPSAPQLTKGGGCRQSGWVVLLSDLILWCLVSHWFSLLHTACTQHC